MKHYLVRNVKVPLPDTAEHWKERVAKKIGIPVSSFSMQLYRESIDARKEAFRNLQFIVQTKHSPRPSKGAKNDVLPWEAPRFSVHPGEQKLHHPPVVIGSGPCGLFAAWLLAKYGYCPVVLERGEDVETRTRTVQNFWEKGILNTNSNVQFGEGGAGTFSDGKLTSRSKDPRVSLVLQTLVQYGAPEDILWRQYPHVGTDILRDVVCRIRRDILRMGGTFQFCTQATDFSLHETGLQSITTNQGDIPCEVAVLAIGHSARDTFRLLDKKNIAMAPKNFAMGFRIEHPQFLIEKAQYKNYADSPLVPRASYQLTSQIIQGSSKRGVYTFCMCPGGYVVNASSEEEKLCVNGMSYRARDGRNANSAVLTTVSAEEFGEELFGGLQFQEAVERKAFLLGASAGDYHAPVQCVGDFLKNTPSAQLGSISPTIEPGYTLSDLSALYPKPMITAIQESLLFWEKKIPGFAKSDAVLTGVEARSSSPIRILRNESGQSISCSGLYPAGEGAGYAGGIVSAAIDGLNAAKHIIESYQPL